VTEQPRLECDLIMRGGITSGVVYPMAVVKLAERYRFRSIGGTSAGAIAAAVTAAASYGRRNGHDGFAGLRKLPGELGDVTPNGRTTLMNLFKADEGTAPLLSLGLAAIGHDHPLKKLRALFSAFPLGSALGAVFGLLPILLLVIAMPGPEDAAGWFFLILAVIVSGLLALIGALSGGVLSALLCARNEIPKNAYGICSGRGDVDSSGVPGLTDWLHALLQDVAGRGGDPEAEPLTFGDLWNTGDDTAERDIELVLMTTNITQGIAHRFPFLDRPDSPFYFNEREFRRLFPKEIVDWIVQKARPADAYPDIHCPNGFFGLPKAADLPILLGARFSLSFPFLLSAVPLYAGNASSRNKEGKWQLERCWFSDGGLTSNFPIHFFDSLLPSRPTFGINLMPNTAIAVERNGASENVSAPASEMADGDSEREPMDMVWMLKSNEPRQTAVFNNFERKNTKLLSFFGALFDTARNWTDSELMAMPGYRDRIIHIRLNDGEGGMNLDMKPEIIADLGKRGEAAGDLLSARFAPNPDKDPQTGEEIQLTWDNHRWVRYRATMAALEDIARRFRRSFRQSADPTSPWESYDRLIEREVGDAPSHQWANSSQRDHAIAITKAFTQFVDGWEDEDQTFDHTDPEGKGRSPRPKSSLRVMPPGDSDPMMERAAGHGGEEVS